MQKLPLILAVILTAAGPEAVANGTAAASQSNAASIITASPLPPSPATAPIILTPDDREAIARVAFAEAGNQGEEGLAGVMFTILNRIRAGTWGATAQDVVDAQGQFEPITDVGGQWQSLPALSATQEVEASTILDLIVQERLPDPTNGALYFQNPAIVAQRAADGEVTPSLVNFGGQAPIAVIRNHAFFATFTSSGAPASIISLPGVPDAQKPHLFIDGKIPAQLASGTGNTTGLFVPLDSSVAQSQGDHNAPGLFVAVTTPQPISTPGGLPPSPGAIGN